MNKIKLFIASVLFCAMGYTGYTAYEKITMSETEKFMLTNIEALTSREVPGGNDYPCVRSYINSDKNDMYAVLRTRCNDCVYTWLKSPKDESICYK